MFATRRQQQPLLRSCLEPLAEGGDGEKRVDKARNGGEQRETETEPYKWDPPVRMTFFIFANTFFRSPKTWKILDVLGDAQRSLRGTRTSG
jgi:hypothetical protein